MAGRHFDVSTPLGKMMLRRGISRVELAKRSGVSERALTYMARGDFRLNAANLAKVCIVLKCQPADLLPANT